MNAEVKQRIELIARGEIPQGYKKTKVGIVPQEWAEKILGDFCVFSGGGTPSTKVIEYWAGDIPWISTSDVRLDDIKNIDISRYITQKAIEDSATKMCPPNSILITSRVGVGKIAISPKELCTSQDFINIIKYEGNGYFLAMLIHREIKKLLRMVQGTSIKGLTVNAVKALNLCWPILIEQEKIAHILTTCDRLIELKTKLLDEKEQQKKYLMQNLLSGKKRLEGFQEPWREARLREIFSERIETNYGNLELLSITTNKGVVPRSELEKKDSSSEDKSKYLKICVGDIGYNTMRMWQGVSGISKYEGIVSPAYTVLKPLNGHNAQFFAYFFKLPEIIFLFYRYSQGLVDDTRSLKYNSFKKIKICIPYNINEQTAIAQILSTADQEIQLLQKDLEAWQEQKKALLQLLLTGIVRA